MKYKEIAEKCGVSISTVSRALNGKPGVNEALRSRIFSLVEHEKSAGTDSVAFESAVRKKRGKKAGKSYVGIILLGSHSYFCYETLGAIYDALKSYGYTMGVFRVDDNGDEIAEAASLEKEDRLAGLILLGGRYDYAFEEIKNISVPFVMCGYTNRFGTLPLDSYSSVSCDDYMTGYDAAEVLIKAGHRRIGAVFTKTDDRSISALKYNGFLAALADHGIEHDPGLVVESDDDDMESAYQSAKKLMERGEKMTAVYTVSDNMAIGIMKALADSGIKVPKDMSLISIDGLDFTRYTVPTLTTMVQPMREMGLECVEQLVSLINGGPHRQIILPSALRPGETLKKNKK